MGSDLWLGAATTLVGAALGGAISLALNRQQMKDRRAERAEEALREERRRSADRRFEAYSDFLMRARSYRNALRAHYTPSELKLTTDELAVLKRSANDASALVFLVTESTRVSAACHDLLDTFDRAQNTVNKSDSHSTNDSWPEHGEESGRAMREFENAARAELEVRGAERPWISTVAPVGPKSS